MDADARFPQETIDACRAEGLLGALVPAELGGLGHDLRQGAAVVHELARHCASSAMVLAMHHIQVASLVRHGDTGALQAYVRRVAEEQLLLASATTEIGIGGNIRSSTCHVEAHGDRFTLVKQAPVISYGQHADAILATARRAVDSAGSDQVLVVCEQPSLTLTRSRAGTPWASGAPARWASPSRPPATSTSSARPPSVRSRYTDAAHLAPAVVLAVAGARRRGRGPRQRVVQHAARRDLGTVPPGATRLAQLLVTRQQMAGPIEALMTRYLEVGDDPGATAAPAFMTEINTLKVGASTTVVDIVGQAMLICGMQGYRRTLRSPSAGCCATPTARR